MLCISRLLVPLLRYAHQEPSVAAKQYPRKRQSHAAIYAKLWRERVLTALQLVDFTSSRFLVKGLERVWSDIVACTI